MHIISTLIEIYLNLYTQIKTYWIHHSYLCRFFRRFPENIQLDRYNYRSLECSHSCWGKNICSLWNSNIHLHLRSEDSK